MADDRALNTLPDVPDNLDFALYDFLSKVKNGLDSYIEIVGSSDTYDGWIEGDLTTNDHGELVGLGDQEDHDWCVTLDGTRPMEANWEYGSYQIQNHLLHNVADEAARLALTTPISKIVFQVDELRPYVGTEDPSAGDFDAYDVLCVQSETTNGSTTVVDTLENHTFTNTVKEHDTDGGVKFGSSSLKSTSGDGSNCYATYSTDFSFGTGDFTISFWMYRDATFGAGKDILSCNRLSSPNWLIHITNSGFKFYYDGANDFSWAIAESTGVWEYYELSRDGNDISFSLDGALISTQDCTGADFDGSAYFRLLGDVWPPDCHMEELRISKGVARHTSWPFAVPTEPWEGSSTANWEALAYYDEVVLRDGTHTLTGDWDIGGGRYIAGDKFRARDGDGMYLVDDDDNGIFIKDGGHVGINETDPTEWLEVNPDTDVSAVIGRAHIGYNGTDGDVATFSHCDQDGAATYALAQNASGDVWLNAVTGQAIYVRINDTNIATINVSGITMVSGDYLATDKVRAIDGDGLYLTDDGNAGYIFLEDGGDIGFNVAPDYRYHFYDADSGATNSSTFYTDLNFSGDITGGAAANISQIGHDLNVNSTLIGDQVDDKQTLYGIRLGTATAANADCYSLQALYVGATHGHTTNMNTMYGGKLVAMNASTGTIADSRGFYGIAGNSAAGTSTACTGLSAEVWQYVAGSTTTTAYGVKSAIWFAAGTCTTGYLYYGYYNANLPTTAWGIYIPSPNHYNYLYGYTGLMATPNWGSALTLGFSTENLEFVDAGSAAATQQDWIEVQVGGNTGYIHVYAAK